MKVIEAEKLSEIKKTGKSTAADANRRSQIESSRFYRVVWRWHFYAGLIVLPIIIIASLTGAVYVFREEVERIVYYPNVMFTISQEEQRVSYDEQAATAKQHAPENAQLFMLAVQPEDDRATSFMFRSERGDTYTVYVNQYTGAWQGTYKEGDLFFDLILLIHTNLFVGLTGAILVELATSWGIVLLITGFFLWLPRRKNKFWGVFLPRLRAKSYVVWRDLHSTLSFYSILFVFLILLTGLFFSRGFGTAYLLASYASGGLPKTLLDPAKSNVPVSNTPAVSFDGVVEICRQRKIQGSMLVIVPSDNDGSYQVLGLPRDISSPSQVSITVIDRYSGTILEADNWATFPKMFKTQILTLTIHTGSIYGTPTKILAFLVCLILIFASVSGAVMWWIRRPQGKLGIASKNKDYKNSKIMIGTIIFLGVLMPTVGASLLLILFGDWFWRRIIYLRSKPHPEGGL